MLEVSKPPLPAGGADPMSARPGSAGGGSQAQAQASSAGLAAATALHDYKAKARKMLPDVE